MFPDPLYLSREQARLVDRLALEELGLPGLVLMESAGRGAARALLPHLRSGELAACVLCGRGNNGGDGYVVARHLDLHGVEVHVVETAREAELSPDARVMREAARALGLGLHAAPGGEELSRLCGELPAAAWIDALLGTGFRGELRPRERGLLEAAIGGATAPGAAWYALDLPSGMDADTGLAADCVPHCERTLSFVAPKRGFRAVAARARLGIVEVVDIGLPRRFVERACQERAS